MEFSNNKQRKKKSLKLKVAHLKLEVEERKEELDSYSEEFIKTMNKISDLMSAEIPQEDLIQPTIIDKTTDNEEFQPVDDGKADLPEDIKKIWKKIAAITHPDKTKDKTCAKTQQLDQRDDESPRVPRSAAKLCPH